jgi:hypothetical protein
MRVPVLSPLSLREERGPDGITLWIDIPFRDADGDVNMVDWSIVAASFSDAWGQEWTVGGQEWDADIFLYAGGGDSFSSWVRSHPGGGPDQPDLANGTVVVSWAGSCSSGDPFSGSVSSRLAPP